MTIRNGLLALTLFAPLMTVGCNKDDGETGETGDTSYEGARVRTPDLGWRVQVRDEVVDHDEVR